MGFLERLSKMTSNTPRTGITDTTTGAPGKEYMPNRSRAATAEREIPSHVVEVWCGHCERGRTHVLKMCSSIRILPPASAQTLCAPLTAALTEVPPRRALPTAAEGTASIFGNRASPSPCPFSGPHGNLSVYSNSH